jgi:hypothetical protein
MHLRSAGEDGVAAVEFVSQPTDKENPRKFLWALEIET